MQAPHPTRHPLDGTGGRAPLPRDVRPTSRAGDGASSARGRSDAPHRDATASSRILVVEDDRDINALVSRYLVEHDFEVLAVFDTSEAEAALERQPVDLVVLDVNLPGDDGFSLCVRLRRRSRIPIVFLTARSEDTDRILGLELGADDYVSKPFNPRELLARIRAVLRRFRQADEPARALRFNAWRVDLIRRCLSNPDGIDVSLTGAEYELLLLFCEHAGRVLSRNRLLELTGASAISGRSIDILVSRLRHKIEHDPKEPTLIKTVRSGGYVFSAEVAQEC